MSPHTVTGASTFNIVSSARSISVPGEEVKGEESSRRGRSQVGGGERREWGGGKNKSLHN